MSEIAIEFQNCSKLYRLGNNQGSLREALASIPRLLNPRKVKTGEQNDLWALKEVSFEVKRGEVLGIIGNNGAGKTTILKLLSRITQPTSGRVVTNGRISSLIELAAGFHPELTGRENIYLNGVILGLTRKDVDRKFESIIRFADLEQFLDTPVKHYSSGMWARLGFAVAAHVEPDLLLIDEVLAVGDAAFQYKCFERMNQLVSQNKTIVFVSHNLDAIQHLSHRILWLDQGKVKLLGKPEKVLRGYLDEIENEKKKTIQNIDSKGGLKIEQVEFMHEDGRISEEFIQGEDIIVRLHYSSVEEIPHPFFTLGVHDGKSGILFEATMLIDGQAPACIHGNGVVCCRFKAAPLMPRVYHLWGEVRDQYRYAKIVPWQLLRSFHIIESKDKTGENSVSIRHLRESGPIKVPYSWEFHAGK